MKPKGGGGSMKPKEGGDQRSRAVRSIAKRIATHEMAAKEVCSI
jgi:hypothetical protein